MGLAEDKVYTHITRNLKKFGTIRVASLADSLTCLIDSDRDALLAREETRGNQAAVFRFYQHLRCRRGWVQDLIQALHHNNAGHLADELQEIYDTWQTPPPPHLPSTSSFFPAMIHLSLPGSSVTASASSLGAQTPPRGPNPAPLAGQPRRDVPPGERAPVLPSAARSTELEARHPVQESLPKKLPEQESPQALPAGSGGQGPASPGTGVAVSPEQGRDWLSRRPVCVDNGFFGNANHLHRGKAGLALGRSAPSREAAHGAGQPRNEPEENSDVSPESLPRLQEAARGVGQQPPKSVPEKEPVPSSGHGEPVDVRSPLLIQEQFDAERKLLREHPGSVPTPTATPGAAAVPGDAFPSRDASGKPLTQEKKLSIGSTASSPPSVPAKEKVFPASANPVPGTAAPGGSQGTAGRSTSRVSSATSIWAPHSHDEEREEELSKPGILESVPRGSPEVAGRCPSSREPSAPSSTPCSSLGLSSDPLLVSSDSLSSAGAFSREPREKEASGASRDSRPAPRRGSASLITHEVRVDHPPSVQLGAGSDGALNFTSGRDAAPSPPQARLPEGASGGLSLLYILPALGVLSAVAFAVYARLRR
ncbi:MAVS protein, partial [Regulus satrapa]|nr:MAVS protein [Regulus satrapa]